MSVAMWVYFWVLYSIPLIYMSVLISTLLHSFSHLSLFHLLTILPVHLDNSSEQ